MCRDYCPRGAHEAAPGANRLSCASHSYGVAMSRRRRGDDAAQQLMPFVERVKATGIVSSMPKLAEPVTAPSTILSPSPPETSTPIIPMKVDVPNDRRLEAHGAWVFGRGVHLKILSIGGRSWREFLAWETARFAIWQGLSALLVVAMALSSCSGGAPVTKDGWAPLIVRGP